VSFGDTGSAPPAPQCDVTIFILQKHSFLKTFVAELSSKTDEKMTRDILLDPPPSPLCHLVTPLYCLLYFTIKPITITGYCFVIGTSIFENIVIGNIVPYHYYNPNRLGSIESTRFNQINSVQSNRLNQIGSIENTVFLF